MDMDTAPNPTPLAFTTVEDKLDDNEAELVPHLSYVLLTHTSILADFLQAHSSAFSFVHAPYEPP
jgi:hypothetical protein